MLTEEQLKVSANVIGVMVDACVDGGIGKVGAFTVLWREARAGVKLGGGLREQTVEWSCKLSARLKQGTGRFRKKVQLSEWNRRKGGDRWRGDR